MMDRQATTGMNEGGAGRNPNTEAERQEHEVRAARERAEREARETAQRLLDMAAGQGWGVSRPY